MSKRRQIFLTIVLLPVMCFLCSFVSATVGLSEPYLGPIPLEIGIPGGPWYACGSSVTLGYSRNYIVSIPVDNLKIFYRAQMEFYCLDDIDFRSCGTSCYMASCTPRFQFGSLKFAYFDLGMPKAEVSAVSISYELRPFTQNGKTTKTRIEQSQIILAEAPSANVKCPPGVMMKMVAPDFWKTRRKQ